MAKIIGNAIPNMPWEDKPEGYRDPVSRYSGNPVIGRNGNARSNSVFNSAVVPYKDGFAGVFRCDSRSISMDLFAGFSPDGIHWTIDDDCLVMTGADDEVLRKEYRYDARIIPLEGVRMAPRRKETPCYDPFILYSGVQRLYRHLVCGIVCPVVPGGTKTSQSRGMVSGQGTAVYLQSLPLHLSGKA